MDSIDAYKSAALQSMQATVDALQTEVGKAQSYLERAQSSPAAEIGGPASGELGLPAATRRS
jgi:hypothetical protein